MPSSRLGLGGAVVAVCEREARLVLVGLEPLASLRELLDRNHFEHVALLGLDNPEDAVVLNIATYHADERVTVNLKGPIVYNKATQTARQIVPRNASDLPLAHPMGN